MEVREGIEPSHRGFADPSVSTSPPHHFSISNCDPDFIIIIILCMCRDRSSPYLPPVYIYYTGILGCLITYSILFHNNYQLLLQLSVRTKRQRNREEL